MFGLDHYPSKVSHYQSYYRFLETADEHFPYWPEEEAPTQGRWRIYGAQLHPADLQRIYHDNALDFLGERVRTRLA